MIQFNRDDFLSSLSLLLVSLPLSAGIAVASGAAPEAGIITAIFGALFFGFFSSSPLSVYGPAAGLSVVLSTATSVLGGFSHLSLSVLIAGFILLLLSFVDIYRIINFFPRSVMKGMVAGIGLILALKMIPHMLGLDSTLLYSVEFAEGKTNTLSQIWSSFEHMLPGAIIITVSSLVLMGFLRLLANKYKTSPRYSAGVIVIMFGICLNLIFQKYFPSLYLSGEHLLHVTSTKIRFQPFYFDFENLTVVLETAVFITAIIVLEGFITLDLIQKYEPLHSKLNYKKESLLLGIGNILMGLVGALPIMPVFIRSTANISFGAKTRSSVIFHGIWLSLALVFEGVFSFIPMASVSVVLFVVGIGLIDWKEIKKFCSLGKDHWIPFFITLGMIFFVDLIVGIAAGFVIGLVFTLHSSFQRSMVLVNDGERYLLKFHKDVTFLHKGELREHLENIPTGRDIYIDGTGNIFVDKEIEEWLEDYVTLAKDRGSNVYFLTSKLAVSPLFKEI